MLRKEKYSLYAILVAGTAVFGVSGSVFGLSLIDFQRNMNSTITELSVGVSLGSISGCFGSLAATVVLDKFNRQFQYAVYWLILGLATMVFPFCTSKTIYLLISGFQGFMVPFFGTIPNVWVIELFDKSSKTYLQLMHIFGPIGQILGSVITAPFLSKNATENGTHLADDLGGPVEEHQENVFFSNLFATAEYSQLWVPFLVVCLLRILMAVAIIVAYFIKPYRKPAKAEDETEVLYMTLGEFEEAKTDMSRVYHVIFVVLISLVVGLQLTSEFNSNTYLPTYLVKNNRLDQATAAYCQALLSTSTIVGRVVFIFLTMKISTQTFLFINFALIALGSTLILALGQVSLYVVYTGIVLIGFGYSNAFGLLLALVEERITMSNRVMALMNFSGAVFLAVSPITVGRLLDTSPSDFMLLSLTLTLVSLVFYITLVVLEFRRMAGRSKDLK